MKEKWYSPLTIVGNTATNEYYFQRTDIEEETWEEIKKGNYILYVAPRRVGKSSIMKNMVKNHSDNYCCIYEDIEGVKSNEEFYKRFYYLILSTLSKKDKIRKKVKEVYDRLKIKEVAFNKIVFDKNEINYLEEIRNILPEIKKLDVFVVLFLDELPEILNKFIKANKTDDAIEILNNIREWRQDDNFSNFSIVFAGSIGLHHITRKLGRPKYINDLHSIKVPELTKEEAIEFIQKATKDATIKYDEKMIEKLLDKIGHYLPYYISLMLEEINRTCKKEDKRKINNDDIDLAFDNILKEHKNFDDWKSRLKDYLPEHFPFINEVLGYCAFNNKIPVQKINDIAGQYKTDDYMDIIYQLQSDGYIFEHSKNEFKFISPFLKQYWKNINPLYGNK
ncbi:MAG: AAA-like domain-containing protein [Chitinophagales bacterium]